MILMVILSSVIKPTFLCGWNLVLSFCFADAAADNRPRCRRPAHCQRRHCPFTADENLVTDQGQSCGPQVALASELEELFHQEPVLVSVSVPSLDSSSHSPAGRSPGGRCQSPSNRWRASKLSPKQNEVREGSGEPADEEEAELPRLRVALSMIFLDYFKTYLIVPAISYFSSTITKYFIMLSIMSCSPVLSHHWIFFSSSIKVMLASTLIDPSIWHLQTFAIWFYVSYLTTNN